MISVAGVSKRFGSFAAVTDLTFDVGAGEIVGLLGPNGAGKSTTMRILAGVFPPSSGHARIAGYDVIEEPLRARSAVGYFPERVGAYADMTVRSYLNYVGEMKGVRRAALREQTDSALAACGLEAVAGRIIGSLSKGFRQRVGIAQALTGEPVVLILDEPTAGLDPEQVADMRDLIRGLGRERTVILSTHILSEVESTCDRVIILHRGRIVAVDTPAQLNRKVQRTGRLVVEINAPIAEASALLAAQPGVVSLEAQPHAADGAAIFTVFTQPDRDLREQIAHAVAARDWGLRELRSVAYSLEEIFLTLVQSQTSATNEIVDHARVDRLSA